MTASSTGDARQLAAEIGFDSPAREVLEQLPLAAAAAQKHKSALKAIDLAPEDEPALVFALGEVHGQ